ncbi:50S ribosomal protein L30e-like protein [Phycomyces nitens]|nr:50S ribosomal protein L30e-like protein [Phycomyces nitens]
MAKEKKEKKVKQESMDVDSEVETVRYLSPIAHPLAEKKFTKKIFKTIKKAGKAKHVRRGVKEVGKALRKGEKGFVIIAGDISPIDVVAHMPVLCEDNNVPYVFVSSKEELGEASLTKRPTSVAMVVFGGKSKSAKDTEAAADYKEMYDECYAQAKELDEKLVY